MKRRPLSACRFSSLTLPRNHRRPIFNGHKQPYSTPKSKTQSSPPLSNAAGPSLRPRRGSNKPLPLPPILDPGAIAAAQRWRTPKAKPDPKKSTAFQERLYRNAYAHALSSAIRHCPYTGSRLPKSLLTPLSLIPDSRSTPPTPWLLPSALYSEAFPSDAAVPKPGQQAAPKIHVSLREPVARALSLLPPGSEKWLFRGKVEGSRPAVIREDLAAFILALLRRTVCRKLRWPLQHPKTGHLVPLSASLGLTDTAALDAIDNVACILLLRDSLRSPAHDRIGKQLQSIDASLEALATQLANFRKSHGHLFATPSTRHPIYHFKSDALEPRLAPHVRYPPLHFHTAEYRGRRVPVYSLPDLLGEEELARLLEGFEERLRGGGTRYLALTEHRLTAGAQMALLRLQGYIAEPVAGASVDWERKKKGDRSRAAQGAQGKVRVRIEPSGGAGEGGCRDDGPSA